jgi:hypothetical protein
VDAPVAFFFWLKNGQKIVNELKMGKGAASHSHFRASTIPELKVTIFNDIWAS